MLLGNDRPISTVAKHLFVEDRHSPLSALDQPGEEVLTFRLGRRDGPVTRSTEKTRSSPESRR
jgi:hypothetical protein